MNFRSIAGVTCVVLGICLAIFSVGVLCNFESTFKWVLNKRVVLSKKSQGFPIWKDVSNHFDTAFAWHFFNLTNPAEFAKGAKPKLEEVGPFWYKARLSKKNIVFHNENGSVSFEEHRFFEFDEEKSALPDTTVITTINVPLAALATKLGELSYFKSSAVYAALGGVEEVQNPIRTYTVRELTYEGQPSTLVTLSQLKEGIFSAILAMTSDNSAKNSFGFAVDKNETSPGVFNMYTGITGVTDLNRIHSMNKEHILSVWPEDNNNTCNIVDGTFGNLRAPMTNASEERIYVPDMCRQVTTRYQRDIEMSGIRLRRFNLTIDNFDNSEENPLRSCYNKIFELPSGVTEVGPCKKGAPIVMSLPHFMYADESFRKDVEGMNPDPAKHEFIMDHEPMTGMTVQVRGRLQANLRVIKNSVFESTASWPDVTLPLFWQEMHVKAGPGIVSFLKKVEGYPGLGKIAVIIVGLLGLILAVIGAALLFTLRNQRTEELNRKDRAVVYSKAPTTEPRPDV